MRSIAVGRTSTKSLTRRNKLKWEDIEPTAKALVKKNYWRLKAFDLSENDAMFYAKKEFELLIESRTKYNPKRFRAKYKKELKKFLVSLNVKREDKKIETKPEVKKSKVRVIFGSKETRQAFDLLSDPESLIQKLDEVYDPKNSTLRRVLGYHFVKDRVIKDLKEFFVTEDKNEE